MFYDLNLFQFIWAIMPFMRSLCSAEHGKCSINSGPGVELLTHNPRRNSNLLASDRSFWAKRFHHENTSV